MNTPIQKSRTRDILDVLWEHKLYILILIFLIILPHLVGWLTESSPFAIARGTRLVLRGESGVWQATFIEIFALAIFVMSYNLMFGFTGVISFGHALFFGIGAYALGVVLQFGQISDPNVAFFVGIGAVIGLCIVFGLFIGVVSLRLRGVYFAIFTLAIAQIGWYFVENWELTGRDGGFAVKNVPVWIDSTQNRINLYYIALVCFVLVFLFIRRLVNSPTGAVLKAIRENEERAKAIGYNTLAYKLFSIVLASIMAGIAGILFGLMSDSISPQFLGVNYTVDALLMTIIGGVGTFVGPILGATGLHLADVNFRDRVVEIGGASIQLSDSWALITGLIFVLVVLVFPYGIVGTYYRVKLWINKRTTKQIPPAPPPHG
ncbi:MAG: branched-chain amino acid ABC transporter permease [bacterium]|nr:branched-chain amino acid ABC transporter permease [bacterium]